MKSRKLRLRQLEALMAVAECGGEPAAQKWAVGMPRPGFISNAATASCLQVVVGEWRRRRPR